MAQRQRKFLVFGKKPAYGKDVNDFIAKLDLGTTGAFIDFQEVVTITISNNTTEEQLSRQPAAIKLAYEEVAGCINVNVKEIHQGGDSRFQGKPR